MAEAKKTKETKKEIEKVEVIKEEKPKTAKKEVIYKYMDIAGTMVRVSDKISVNFLPYEKNPLQVISNEEIEAIDGTKYPISMLQEHSFKVLSPQEKAPCWIELDAEGNVVKSTPVKHTGKIVLKRKQGVLGKGEPEIPEDDIQWIN